MPKLTKQTLEKRFPCPHCGQTFRTRQGLSGHIQFKHPPGTSKYTTRPIKWLTDIQIYKSVLQSANFSDEVVSELTEILAEWGLIERFIAWAPSEKNLKVGWADFKTYLIVAYAQMYANRRLIDRVDKILARAISRLR